MKQLLKFGLALLFATLLSISLFSCMRSRHVTKSESSKDTTIVTDTKAVITTVETIDTTVVIKGDTTSAVSSLEDTTDQVTETPTMIITNKVNKKTGKVKTTVVNKPKEIQVQGKKETKADITEHTKATGSEKEKGKQVDVKTLGFPWWVWVIGIFLLLLLLALWLIRQYAKRTTGL